MPQLDTPNIEWLITKIGKLEREVEKLKTHETRAAYSPTGYNYIPLDAAVTIITGSYSDVSTWTQIDVSAADADLASAEALNIAVLINDSGSSSNDIYVLLASSSDGANEIKVAAVARGDDTAGSAVVCNSGANGDIWYKLNATAAGTFDMTLKVIGYWA